MVCCTIAHACTGFPRHGLAQVPKLGWLYARAHQRHCGASKFRSAGEAHHSN